jgi:hypothetical protein
VQLQGEAFTKHIERAGTGYHLKGYGALQSGTIDEQHGSLVIADDALARGLEDGTLVVDTRLRDVLRTLRVEDDDRAFAIPSERSMPLSLPAPSVEEDARYAMEAAVLGEADAVRLQRRVDAFEERLASLEHRSLSRLAGRIRGA